VLADFEGAWRITRMIRHCAGAPALFMGTAVWMPDVNGLAYHESGVLKIDGHLEIRSERRYHWDAGLNVTFDDGWFFHRVPSEGGQTAHWCDPDHYAVTYHFNKWPVFEVEWRVMGPRKDYRMHSRYERAVSG
jgi:hypothetical protein